MKMTEHYVPETNKNMLTLPFIGTDHIVNEKYCSYRQLQTFINVRDLYYNLADTKFSEVFLDKNKDKKIEHEKFKQMVTNRLETAEDYSNKYPQLIQNMNNFVVGLNSNNVLNPNVIYQNTGVLKVEQSMFLPFNSLGQLQMKVQLLHMIINDNFNNVELPVTIIVDPDFAIMNEIHLGNRMNDVYLNVEIPDYVRTLSPKYKNLCTYDNFADTLVNCHNQMYLDKLNKKQEYAEKFADYDFSQIEPEFIATPGHWLAGYQHQTVFVDQGTATHDTSLMLRHLDKEDSSNIPSFGTGNMMIEIMTNMHIAWQLVYPQYWDEYDSFEKWSLIVNSLNIATYTKNCQLPTLIKFLKTLDYYNVDLVTVFTQDFIVAGQRFFEDHPEYTK